MRFFAPVALLSVVLATSVAAQTASTNEQRAAPSAPTSDKKADKKADGVVCRKETPTGSQFPVKVCTTAEQRKAQRGVAQRAQESMQSAAPALPQ